MTDVAWRDPPRDYAEFARLLATALRDLSTALTAAEVRGNFSLTFKAQEYAGEVLDQVVELEGDVVPVYMPGWSAERTLERLYG